MGLFDTFVYECPYCNTETESQTKAFECGLARLSIGDKIDKSTSLKLLMKNPCHSCNRNATAIISDGMVIAFKKSEFATKEEKQWGEINEVEQ